MFAKFIPRLGLRSKFTLLVVFLLICVFTIQSFILITKNLNLAREGLSNEVKTYTALSTLQVGASFDQYYLENHFRFGEIINDVLNSSNKTITKLQVFNTSGDLLYDSLNLFKDERDNIAYKTLLPEVGFAKGSLLDYVQKIDPTYTISGDNKEVDSIVFPYLDNYNHHQYSIVYFISYNRIYEKLYSEIINVVLISIISLVLGSLLIIFSVDKFMIIPIKKVAQGAQLLELGGLNNVLTVNTRDEIEDLAHSFNKMAYSLLKSQEALKFDRDTIAAEKEKSQLVLYGITDAVIAVDLNRKIIIFNKAAQDLTGLKEDEVLGKYISEVIQVYEKDDYIHEFTYCPINGDIGEGIVFSRQHLKINTAKKDTYVNLVTGRIKEGSKINLGCILTLHDISKERELEEMKLDFVSMAAHELRTPLTSIKGYLYVFIQKYKDKMDKEQQVFVTRMNIATQRLVALVENLLDVARIERGALTIHPEEIDWLKNVKEILNEIKDQAFDKKIQIKLFEPKEKLPLINVDRFRINEVLTNLLTNAITYTPSDGEIVVSIEKKDGSIITHIKDTGQGIPKEALPHLFTKFFRVSGKLEQGSKGTGLGLYITKSIVNMHGGKIWVDSALGVGSTFSFSIPIKPFELVKSLKTDSWQQEHIVLT